MGIEKIHYVEYIGPDEIHYIHRTDKRDLNRYLNKPNVFAVRFFRWTIDNKNVTEKSRVTPYYYATPKDNELSIEEKINSDKIESNLIDTFKTLKSHIGEYVRVHYYINENNKYKHEDILGKLIDVNYFNNVVIYANDLPISIPFVGEGTYIDYINTAHEIIYKSNIDINNTFDENIINLYGKNIYQKRKIRRK